MVDPEFSRLVSASDVNALRPGAIPFSQPLIDSIAESIRSECGWHIAGSRTETIKIDSNGSAVLRLPTLLMTGFTSAQCTETGEELTVHPETGWSEGGLLVLSERPFTPGGTWTSPTRNRRAFPIGFRAVTVTFTHGYETCPADLIRLIASTAQRRIISETLVGRAVTFDAAPDTFTDAGILAKYKLASRP